MKDIVGFEGLYAITDDGKVWSYRSNKFLKPGKDRDGYLRVNLCDGNGGKFTKKVHRIVAEAYIPNPLNLATVDHIDNDKTHNYVKNLHWMTRIDNMSKERPHLAPMKIRCVETNEVFESLSDCYRKTGCDKGDLCRHLKGRKKHVHGFHFVVVEDLERVD